MKELPTFEAGKNYLLSDRILSDICQAIRERTPIAGPGLVSKETPVGIVLRVNLDEVLYLPSVSHPSGSRSDDSSSSNGDGDGSGSGEGSGSSASSPKSPSLSDSTKTAILRVRKGRKEAFVQLVCVEAPEAKFEDVVEVAICPRTGRGSAAICPIWRQTVEPTSIRAVCVHADGFDGWPAASLTPAARRVHVALKGAKLPKVALVTLEGVRRGHGGRFRERTAAEAQSNARFWASARKGARL